MKLDFLQTVALSVANERSTKRVLNRIVKGLAASPDVVLARIWLLSPADICEVCQNRPDCSNHTECPFASCRPTAESPEDVPCLHLVASDGNPINTDDPCPTGIDGRFKRIPLGVQKVGKIGETGESILLNNVDELPDWLKDPQWAKREQIRSFAGHPLMYRGENLGVLAIFSRSHVMETDLAVLHTFADYAAAAISNARAFNEIELLHKQLEAENEYLRKEVQTKYSSERILGHSSATQKILQQIELVAPTESSVLIQGESGTGKELVAREIHNQSMRKERPLVRVSCAAIPKELFESEFFGHIKGAFTGAVRDRVGRFQIADGGTLFLDEVGEIPLELQPKLLRVLQEGEFEAVGDDSARSVDVRIIAATNRDLKDEVAKGRFREDLFFRLSVFPIEVPPLRQRRSDIGLLAAHFIYHIAHRLSIKPPSLKEKHVKQLEAYDWPGNVRELENVIERALITGRGNHLNFDLGLSSIPNHQKPAQASRSMLPRGDDDVLTADQIKTIERDNIITALKLCRWKISGQDGAALLLGIKPTTLSSKIKSMNIVRQL
jgi:transcriptional regulator with GAF, ATPase, and Fis domain